MVAIHGECRSAVLYPNAMKNFPLKFSYNMHFPIKQIGFLKIYRKKLRK